MALLVVSLQKTNKFNEVLQRPPEIEAEIEAALQLSNRELIAKAAHEHTHKNYMSSECMVYLIRQDLHNTDRILVDALTPHLLNRCTANLKRTVTGFQEPMLTNVRDDILGKLVLLLVDPEGAADFFEVRFALAFARLRIDFCHRYKRHKDNLVYIDEYTQEDPGDAYDSFAGAADHTTREFDQEERLCLKQALGSLTEQERKIILLHRVGGIPINAGEKHLVGIMGLSERTIRNRLRSAESRLEAYKENRL